MDRELNVRAAGLDADLANDRERRVAHHLIFLVGQRLHRRDSDRIACVHAHRIEIFDRTNDNAVIHSVAHHFHLEFFPADERLFDQHFANRRHGKTAAGDFVQIVRIIGDAAAAPAECERRPNDERKSSDFFCDAARVGKRTRNARAGNVQTDPQHRFLEQLSIFAFRNRFRIRADQFHFVPRERAVAIQFHRRVQRGLSAHRRQNRVRLFALDDRLDHVDRYRFDISPIGEFRIGHDRRRVRIYQHDPIAFFAQRLARLYTGIIKFAALSDHDWTGAYQQNFF